MREDENPDGETFVSSINGFDFINDNYLSTCSGRGIIITVDVCKRV